MELPEKHLNGGRIEEGFALKLSFRDGRKVVMNLLLVFIPTHYVLHVQSISHSD